MNSLLRKASNIFKDNSTRTHDYGQRTPLARDPTSNDSDTVTFESPNSGTIPRNNDPDSAANDTCNSLPYDILPRNILAFRTITTLLAKIQQDRPIAYSNAFDRHDLSPENKQELKISNALANLANPDIDVVALVTKFSGFSDALDVVVCGGNLVGNRDNDQPPPSKSSIWEILFARNPGNSKLPMKELLPTNPVQGPTISAVEKPADVKSDDAKELIRYIDEDW